MRRTLGRTIRRVANWLFRFGDWVEGGDVTVIPIDLEPEHALVVFREVVAKRSEARGDEPA